jgi:acyl-CoA thioester hydrolase
MPEPVSDPLADFPVVVALPVQWGDQDAFGHVNNTVYFRWFETARIAYCDRLGFEGSPARLAPILAAISCSYRRQVTFPDTVRVGARITSIGRSSMKMEYRLVSERLGEVAAEGDSTIVAFDYVDNRSLPVPVSIREAIARLEGKSI